jgi:hypothetical protein
VFAIQFRVPASGALLATMNLVFHAHQSGRFIRMIHTNIHWFCFHWFRYDIVIMVSNNNRDSDGFIISSRSRLTIPENTAIAGAVDSVLSVLRSDEG